MAALAGVVTLVVVLRKPMICGPPLRVRLNMRAEDSPGRERIAKKSVLATYPVKSMDGARVGDKIRTHQLRVVQEDGAISACHKNWIAIL